MSTCHVLVKILFAHLTTIDETRFQANTLEQLVTSKYPITFSESDMSHRLLAVVGTTTPNDYSSYHMATAASYLSSRLHHALYLSSFQHFLIPLTNH